MPNRFFMALFGIFWAVSAHAQDSWNVDHASSQVGFTVEIGGATTSGSFGGWSASIEFDPALANAGSVWVEIEMPTVTIDDPRASAIARTAWLAVSEQPTAVFHADLFNYQPDGSLTVNGWLTLKGVQVPMSLAGTLLIEGDTAQADLSGTIERLSHNIGVGQDAVSANVTAHAVLTAHRQK